MKKILLGLFLLFSGLSYGQTSNDADAEAFITACDADPAGKLTYIQKVYITQLVEGLKSIGVWSKCKAIYPFVGGTAFKHKFNLKDPRDLDAAFRLAFFNSPTHSANGVQFDGVNDYANTFFNPSTNLTSTSTNTTIYIKSSSSSTINTTPITFGSILNIGSEGSLAISNRHNGTSNTKYYVSTNSGLLDAAIQPSPTAIPLLGLVMGNLISNNISLINNGLEVNTAKSKSAFSNLPNQNLYIGAANGISNTAANFDNKLINYLSVGDGLTENQIIQLSHLVTYSQTTLQRQ